MEDRQVKYLGATHEGKKHDKKICDEEGTVFPDGIDLYRDTAYQGHEVPNVTVHQPKKKPRNGKLSYEDKESNRLISRIRVVIEHIISGIKRCRVVKDVLKKRSRAGMTTTPPGCGSWRRGRSCSARSWIATA